MRLLLFKIKFYYKIIIISLPTHFEVTTGDIVVVIVSVVVFTIKLWLKGISVVVIVVFLGIVLAGDGEFLLFFLFKINKNNLFYF